MFHGVFKWPETGFPRRGFASPLRQKSEAFYPRTDRQRFSRKNAFLQAEISGVDLHAVIFMVEQAVQNIDAFASGFVAAQVFSHFFFDALQRLGRAIAQFDFFLVPLVILRQLDFGKLRDHKIIICYHFNSPINFLIFFKKTSELHIIRTHTASRMTFGQRQNSKRRSQTRRR